MEKFQRSFEGFRKSLKKFKEIIDNPAILEFFKDEFIVEIATKRFEYTFESMWKSSKEFLRIKGVECNSPRSCFREMIKEGVVPEGLEGILAEMIVLRNSLVHIYDEKAAKDIYLKIKTDEILNTFEAVLKGLMRPLHSI